MSNHFNQYKSDFIATFKRLGQKRHYFEVFRDFVHMMAFSLHNSICKNDDFEAEYLTIVARYSKQEVDLIAQLSGLTVLALESRLCDFLGQMFMELELGSSRGGQFFTPYAVSRMMAQLTFSGILDDLKQMPYISLSEPTCGAGGMVIAIAETMLEAGSNPQEQLWVCCQDIDSVAAMMCYIQISILGIPGVVVTGNTLALECRRAMYTPFHYLFSWDAKIEWWDCLKRFFNLISQLNGSNQNLLLGQSEGSESGAISREPEFELEASQGVGTLPGRAPIRRFPKGVKFSHSVKHSLDEEQLTFQF